MKKLLKKFLAVSVAAGSLFFVPQIYNADLIQIVQAEIKTYTGVGECVQGDLITLEQAKNYAKLKAELNAKDQAGVYIAQYSKMENYNLTENKIDLITNSIVNIVGEVQYKTETTMFGNSPVVKYVATLKANIDTDGINKYIQRDQKNSEDGKTSAQSELQSATKDIKDGLNKIDELIERYNKATSQAEKDQIRAEFNDADRKVLAGQKNDEGIEFANKGEYQKAIELYNEALAFNSNYDWAYNNRGCAYAELKKYDAAIADLNKAIQLNPNYADAYNNRGIAYKILKQYDAAIADFSKAIELNPNDAYYAYNNRGGSYCLIRKFKKAIADATKAIEIDPNIANAYVIRGYCYQALGETEKANADFAKAKQFGYQG